MKELYEKNELTFALVWIAIYCVLQSLANPLNQMIGIAYAASAVFGVLQTVILAVVFAGLLTIAGVQTFRRMKNKE